MFVLPLIKSAIKSYRKANPGKAVEKAFLPDVFRLLIRGFNYYDPRFGAGFYDGTWNTGFDNAKTIQKIRCLSLLLHANYEILKDGELNGAMDQGEADRVVALIPGCVYKKKTPGMLLIWISLNSLLRLSKTSF